MNVGLTLEGGRELAATLRALERAVSQEIQIDALTAGAEPIRAYAAGLAPRSRKATPHVADEIVIAARSASQQERRDRGDEALVEVGPSKKPHDHFYDYFQEYGTRRHPPQPHMRPAFDTQEDTALRITLSRLWASIEAVAASEAKR